MSWDPIDNERKRFPNDEQLRAQPKPSSAHTLALYFVGALLVSMLVAAILRGQW